MKTGNYVVLAVHLCHLPLPSDHPDYGRLYSHPGRWVLNLALAQKKHTSITPHLIVQVPGASRDFETEIEGVPVAFIRIPNRFRAATLFERDRRLLACKALEKKPDILHAHGTEEAYGLAAQSSGKPYVITAQGVFGMINRILPPPLFSRERVIEWLEHRCLSRACHVIAKSEYVQTGLKDLFPNLKLHRIPNTFDPRLASLPQVAREEKSMVFVGMITPRKGLDCLARALELAHTHCGSWKLHIIGNKGPGIGTYERAILARFRHLLGDRLVLHGIVPAIEAASIVSSCQLLVAPSLEEMFGNQLIEALLVGTWPVVSSGTAMAENVRFLSTGSVFENGSADDLARSIEKAFLNLKFWNSLETREKLEKWMGPAKIALEHEILYHQVIKERQ